jgi:hypothetical protein
MSDEVIKYLITQDRGEHGMPAAQTTIEIPAGWKITYGPVLGEIKGGEQVRRGTVQPVGNCIRVYETKDKQRMLIPNVVAFRDLRVPVMQVVDAKEVESSLLMDKNTGESVPQGRGFSYPKGV